MGKLKISSQWSFALLILIGVFALFVPSFLSKKDPLRKAQIPQETIDFLNKISGLVDVKFKFKKDPDPSDWEKYYRGDMLSVEDSCFIIYYMATDSVQERSKADLALDLANKAILHSERVMGHYPYPWSQSQKNRKLPIYIANSTKTYKLIARNIFGSSNVDNSVGLYVFQYSNMGAMALGIIISPEAWTVFDADQKESFRRVLWHEINHHVFYSKFDFLSNKIPPLWFTEGLAEYFAGNKARAKEISTTKLNKYHLNADVFNSDAYWVGYTAFLCVEYKTSQSDVSELINASYSHRYQNAIQLSNNMSIDDWDGEWKEYLMKHY